MRLSETQVNSILSALNLFLENCPVELRLYGSRADTSKKGGDIDLVLVFDRHGDAEKLALSKHIILNEIKKEIGDQKIDLSFIDKSEFLNDSFWKTVEPKSIVLNRWS